MKPHILKRLREAMGVDTDDPSKDKEINSLSPREQWEKFLHWEGIIGYDRLLHEAHDEFFGPNMEDDPPKEKEA